MSLVHACKRHACPAGNTDPCASLRQRWLNHTYQWPLKQHVEVHGFLHWLRPLEGLLRYLSNTWQQRWQLGINSGIFAPTHVTMRPPGDGVMPDVETFHVRRHSSHTFKCRQHGACGGQRLKCQMQTTVRPSLTTVPHGCVPELYKINNLVAGLGSRLAPCIAELNALHASQFDVSGPMPIMSGAAYGSWLSWFQGVLNGSMLVLPIFMHGGVAW